MSYDKVVDSARLDGALTATAEAIRSKTDSTEPIPFDMDEGFKAAVEGIASGGGDTEAAYNEGVQDGKRAMWNVVQQNGERTNYQHAFYEGSAANPVWTDETFNPIHDIVPTTLYGAFRGTGIVDFPALFNRQGIRFSTCNCTRMDDAFSYSQYLKHIGELDTTLMSRLYGEFRNSISLVTIDKIILKADGSQTFVATFDGATSLANITFEGVIATDINFSACPLSVESMKSVILHLQNMYEDPYVDFTTTVKFSAACWNALEADSTAPNGDTWKDYTENLGWNT